MTYSIDIVGLGAGDIDQLPLGIYKKLMKQTKQLYIRTADHPVIQQLQEEGLVFESFDDIYETSGLFGDVYQKIADRLLYASYQNPVVYAVPGHPMMAEKTVQLLLEQNDIPINILGGQSYLDALFASLKIDPIEGFQLIDGLDFERHQLDYHHHMIFSQVYDQFTAGHVKLALLEDLPPDYWIKIVMAAGSQQEKVVDIRLDELDRTLNEVHNLISVYVPPAPNNMLHHTFNRLREVIYTLRQPGGCPWDRAQTHETLRIYAVEEVYELLEAIDEQDDDHIVEELGDLLLQVMLHSQIGEDQGYFTIEDVIRSITDKMIHRHPHVFENQSVNLEGYDQKTWDELKHEEKQGERSSLLDGIPKELPGLAKAYKLQNKADKSALIQQDEQTSWKQLYQELEELQGLIREQSDIEQKIGDVLFVFVQLARYYNINPELALHQVNTAFSSKFIFMEQLIQAKDQSIHELDKNSLNQFWKQAKRNE